MKRQNYRKKSVCSRNIHIETEGLLLLAPALLSILVFKYFPMILGTFISFFKMDIVNLPGTYVGLDNYIRAFTDKNFMTSFFNTLKIFIYTVCMNFWPPILLAILINEIKKGKTFFRLGFFIPACAPMIAMTVLWKLFWNPDYGLANYIIGLIGIEPQMWLNSEKLVYFCIHFPGLIICGGMNMVIYLSALQDISEELYEAAVLDGAGIISRIKNVTIPSIKNIIFLMLTLSMISSLNAMENIMIYTGGGPGGSTRTMLLYAYQQATDSMDYSYAITMTTIVFVITMILTIVLNKKTNKEDL